ncbi:hypothetical protein CGRA01v4_01445 [Colletotrichum graminicola]|nr:hypothetical protein CGRA01v4_01445 [Colletotrichum graminicola]
MPSAEPVALIVVITSLPTRPMMPKKKKKSDEESVGVYKHTSSGRRPRQRQRYRTAPALPKCGCGAPYVDNARVPTKRGIRSTRKDPGSDDRAMERNGWPRLGQTRVGRHTDMPLPLFPLSMSTDWLNVCQPVKPPAASGSSGSGGRQGCPCHPEVSLSVCLSVWAADGVRTVQ